MAPQSSARRHGLGPEEHRACSHLAAPLLKSREHAFPLRHVSLPPQWSACRAGIRSPSAESIGETAQAIPGRPFNNLIPNGVPA